MKFQLKTYSVKHELYVLGFTWGTRSAYHKFRGLYFGLVFLNCELVWWLWRKRVSYKNES